VNTGKFSAARIATAEGSVECSTPLATVSRLATLEASLRNAGLEIAEIIAAANGPFDGTAKVEAASSKRITSKPTGTKKITEPGTHVMTPAAA